MPDQEGLRETAPHIPCTGVGSISVPKRFLASVWTIHKCWMSDRSSSFLLQSRQGTSDFLCCLSLWGLSFSLPLYCLWHTSQWYPPLGIFGTASSSFMFFFHPLLPWTQLPQNQAPGGLSSSRRSPLPPCWCRRQTCRRKSGQQKTTARSRRPCWGPTS